jgi:uncharacterized membrane protein YdjX (TVP38/TMEM64 family)
MPTLQEILMLCAIRVMPAFPQNLINYSSRFQKVKRVYFILAAFMDVAIKLYGYAKVNCQAADGVSMNDFFNLATLAPLVLLSSVVAVGVMVKFELDQWRGITDE